MNRPELLVLAMVSCGAAGDRARDVVPESRDTFVDAGAAQPPGDTGYEYIARRPLAVVALAEARGIAPEVARALVNRLADALDACVTEQGRSGAPTQGAARVIAQVAPSGAVQAASVRVDPTPGTAQTALLCLVSPANAISLSASDAGARGLAIEALWGHLAVAREPASP
jgi:hypothetical protein